MSEPTVSASIIDRQLSLTEPEDLSFEDGSSTPLAPVSYTPVPEGEEWVVSLDGQWRVARWPFPTEEADLARPEVNDTDWERVQQPGKVFYADPEAESEPIEDWNRVTLDHIDDEDGAVLRRRVRVPQDWEGRRVYLRFDAIYPAGRIYLDGELLGEHLSGLTPVEYDVTDLVEPGTGAVVAVRLLRKHRFVKMDMVRHACEFAGLAQSARLFAVEPCRIDDYHLWTVLDESLSDGSVEGTVCVRNDAGTEWSVRLTATLSTMDGVQVDSCTREMALEAGSERSCDVALYVNQPDLWNDENPNLYRVGLTLAADGQEAQTVSYRTGFRRLELGPEGAKLNGNFVKFRGVNHLTYHPEGGMHTPKEWLRENLRMMKRANVNAIRTHFLGAPALAELCDEMGMYLLQELPIDWGTNYIHDPEWVGPALMRLEGGIRRDRHHPSVMVWSVGNENMPESAEVAEDGWNHLRIYDRFCRRLDPTRPTMFPPPGPANKIEGIFEVRVGDIADTHYSFELAKKFLKTGEVTNPRSWDADMETLTRGEALERGWSGVWFSSEYGIFNALPDVLNGPYLSIIADEMEDPLGGKNSLQVFIDRLRREWGYMRSEPTCLGGAYFPWICAGTGQGEGGNPWGWVRWAEDADWGVITADLNPKPQFWAMRVLFSPVWFPERLVWEEGEEEIRFTVQNQYNSIDLAECTLRIQMGAGGSYMGQQRQFRDVDVQCAPGEETTVVVPIWKDGVQEALGKGRPALCRCHLLDPTGYRPITTDIIVVPQEMAEPGDTPMPIGPDAKL